MAPSDETLMEAVANGQLNQLAELFRRYRAPLYTFLFRRTNGNQVVAEDTLQDTFERVLKYRSSYRSGQTFKSWVFTIARNVLADHHRQQGRIPISDDFDWQALNVATASPLAKLETSEQQNQLQAAISCLSPSYREVLDLAWKRELKYAEIAQILGTTEGNIKVRMHRACKQLQTHYQKLSQR
ncbi:MAG: RNA polymerase sigma factor [Bacteroidota bacterium]